MQQNTRFDLTGKVALITGASKGIGAAIARGLAECGARVVVSSRKLEAVEAVAQTLRQAGHQAAALAAHLGRMEEARALVDQAQALFGGLDILVNNAAISPVLGPLLSLEEGLFDKIMAVNVKGPLELCKRAHPVLAKRGGGAIINLASVGALSPEPLLGLYSASKAALVTLTKVMAREWGRDGIRVNAICPGLIKTRFSAALWQNEEIAGRVLQQQAIPRLGVPEDVVGLAIFLATDAAALCTGGVYLVDGGYTI
ncbi:MAG: glucose 1-dehydrogenase [candidate division KSB1 bacterium]|nr:glucose 1-dehydrogenase [candidate division KSB1 bacterium]MDZ7275265.1 glucose 1-dehydrogenase [candidate division KSB1 bacterium]MDZ7287433.1 glucose 1-dehydrogenase [candidate division KSB1 bacterium]MDZ7299547.1 glucose 1-dehydrogenase [candidate division KSB1 bacterium]MDZ7309092.1 glucose 1-dehydrogenase [candidate division KSB1 bacterium]